MHRFAALEVTKERRFGETDAKIERRFAEMMQWSFLFWVGAVGAIAALVGVLR